jgi:tetratricopeptide (TPR) repeat protein
MPTPFLSSEEYDERAHQLYNEGQYEEALQVLREGLALYPNAVELHIGVGYAQLAREEFAWARRSFEDALVLEPEHEDGLAGLGESLLKLGQDEAALRCFNRTLELGYGDDIDLMLQVGRALFREGSVRERADFFEAAKEFFETAVQRARRAPGDRLVGYAQHRLGEDDAAVASLRKSLQVDNEHAEARIYLANILYDRGDYEASLYHFERTSTEDHWDELGIWRLIELKRAAYKLAEHDEDLKPWEERLTELRWRARRYRRAVHRGRWCGRERERRGRGGSPARVVGTLLSSLADSKVRDGVGTEEHEVDLGVHSILTREGRELTGSWEEIVQSMRDADTDAAGEGSLRDYMMRIARRTYRETGVRVPSHDAELFVRGSADAGILRIVR